MKSLGFFLSLFILHFSFGIASSQIYRPEDWVSYIDSRYVTSIAGDLQTIYVGTLGGVLRYDRMTEEWIDPLTQASGLGGSSVQLIAIDRLTSQPWFLTEEALAVYQPLSYHFSHFTSLGDLSPKEVQSIGMNPDAIWLEGGSKKVKFDRGRRVWESVSNFPEEIEWFGKRDPDSLDNPKYRFLSPYTVQDKKFREYPMTALIKDGKDLWVGTWGYGVFRYSTFSFLGEKLLSGLSHSNVEAMAKEGESLWFGGSGVTLWNREESASGRWHHIDVEVGFKPVLTGVTSILTEPDSGAHDSGGRVWFGTSDGLIRYQVKDGFWKTLRKFHGLPHNSVTALALDGEEIWIGTKRGLGKISRYGERVISIKELKDLEIYDLYVQPDYLWVATSSGVFLLNKGEGKWGILEDPEGNTGFGTTALEGDGDLIWFGTLIGVLVYDTKEKRWDRFSSELFLPNRRINDFAADEENLWVGTDGGVAKYRKGERTWQTYTISDGLISNVVKAILLDGDYIFFATPKGVTKFYWNDPFLPK